MLVRYIFAFISVLFIILPVYSLATQTIQEICNDGVAHSAHLGGTLFAVPFVFLTFESLQPTRMEAGITTCLGALIFTLVVFINFPILSKICEQRKDSTAIADDPQNAGLFGDEVAHTGEFRNAQMCSKKRH
ncbi:hypothetical protein L596_021601 [Steinernema carpocapsae]|uniref:Uncharacterized protein n=1 Tax=Steinernema carpocapsae TaxID=34508 RepID=A0A4U5MJA0_STECR|nr:hypothetical protein L596_021601 [Steinernema carpocapsae]